MMLKQKSKKSSHQSGSVGSLSQQFVGIYFIEPKPKDVENKGNSENHPPSSYRKYVQKNQIQYYEVYNHTTIKQLWDQWYPRNKIKKSLNLPQNEYVILWNNQYPLRDFYTISTVKNQVNKMHFDQECLLTVMQESECGYYKNQAALTYSSFIKKNPSSYEIAINVISKDNNFYFYLPVATSLNLNYLKLRINQYFQEKYKVNLQQLYTLQIQIESFENSFFQQIQSEGKIQQQIIKSNRYNITDLEIIVNKQISITEVLKLGKILKMMLNKNLILKDVSKFNQVDDFRVNIQYFQRVRGQSESNLNKLKCIQKLSISKNYSDIKNLKIQTLFIEAKLQDAHFTSLHLNEICLRPNDKFQKIEQYIKKFQQKQINFVVIPENMLYYKQMISLENNSLNKSMEQILQILQSPNLAIEFEDLRISCSERRNILKSSIKQDHLKVQKFLDPIIIYTSPYIYKVLNKFLRQYSISRFGNIYNDNSWQYPFCEKLLQSLLILPNYQGKVFRGSLNYQYKYLKGQIIQWNGFNSTSKDLSTAVSFILQGEAPIPYVFVIQTFSGKQIHRFSYYDSQGQVLILPYTRFKVASRQQKYLDNSNQQQPELCSFDNGLQPRLKVTVIQLVQIPIPKQIPGNIVVWIDSNIKKNFEAFQKFLKTKDLKDYDLIQLPCNEYFRIWLEQYKQILSLPDVRVIFITNMRRSASFQQNIITDPSQYEGIQTLKMIRAVLPTATVIFYIRDIVQTKHFLQEAGYSEDQNIQIVNTPKNLERLLIPK